MAGSRPRFGKTFLLLTAAVLLVTVSAIAAYPKEPESKCLTIFGDIGERWKEQGYVIDTDLIKRHTTTITTLDPNFRDAEPQAFSGISTAEALRLCGANKNLTATVVANDQYTASFTVSRLMNTKAIFANKVMEKAITPRNGGAFKLVFEKWQDWDPNAFVWFAHTVFIGPMPESKLVLRNQNKTEILSRSRLCDSSTYQGVQPFFIPRGYQGPIPPLGRKTLVQGVHLSKLLDIINANGKSVELKPWVGQSIKLSPKLAELPIVIATSLDGKLIHPAHGGPYCVIFPREKHPELAQIAPDSGVLYFLKEIVLD